MSAFAGIEGQSAALAVLDRALASDHLASAYLFHGPSGVGKESAARALAIAAMGLDDAGATRVLGGHHPDVRIFRPREEGGGRNLKVEQIREELLPFTQFAPFEARRAFVILPEADVSLPEHPAAGANALLKTLEEPRPNVHFLLLSERPNRLLPTIRSRCQALRFASLPTDVVVRALSRIGANGPLEVAAALSGGRIDRALELAQSGAVDGLFATCLELHRLLETKRPGSYVTFSERLAKLEPKARALQLDALRLFYRDLAVRPYGIRPAFATHADDLARESIQPEAALARDTLVLEVQEILERGANVQVVFDALVFQLGSTH